ncbi:PUA domain-containing protein [Desulfurococcus amylolyticus]|uniref:PUA domain-containing protein n=1 Tax=Desulfurococcus amylolyticus TaxID=94694 RepID=UPI000AAF0BF1|nr:PUA domain-containing protein [Desulfurococcus amylolyticus]
MSWRVRSLLVKPYGSIVDILVEKLKTPPMRMYLRVNTVKTTPHRLVELLRERGIEAYIDEYIEEAAYTVVQGPFPLECDTDKYIVVDDKTASSLILGANLYRPGVVKSSIFSEGDKLLAVTRQGTPLACLEAVTSSRSLHKMRRGLVARNTSSPFKAPRISELDIYKQGLLYPQGYPSIVTTRVLDPRPGELIVDMNASPGGKTSHIVQLTKGGARIIAIDRSPGKITELKNTLSHLGLDLNVIAIPHDSRYLHYDFSLLGKADKVLIDPPCSNLGVRPRLLENRSYKDVENLSSYQRQFLKTAALIVKPGGYIVYSTCTLTLEENEENILYAVEELGLECVELPENPPYTDKTIYKGVIGYRYTPLNMDMPGHFIAVLKRSSSSS